MNKREFLRSLSEENDLDVESSKTLLDMVLDHIKSVLLDEHRLMLSEFGTFTTQFKKRRRVADNLNVFGKGTDEKVAPARLQVRFKPAKKFKDALIERGEALRSEMGLDDESDGDTND